MASRAEWTQYAVPTWGRGELWTDDGVVLAHEFRFAGSHPTDLTPPADDASTFSADLVRRLIAFLRGDDVSLADVPLDLDWTTPFQRAVADALRELPRGEVVSYGELAAVAGYPGAARAVGSFCAENRFMFLVPCHRVVGASGIGGYGSAGVGVKRRLLELEGVRL
jgi:methylated-DNA-[protein]-cysteine S-methyltransferase